MRALPKRLPEGAAGNKMRALKSRRAVGVEGDQLQGTESQLRTTIPDGEGYPPGASHTPRGRNSASRRGREEISKGDRRTAPGASCQQVRPGRRGGNRGGMARTRRTRRRLTHTWINCFKGNKRSETRLFAELEKNRRESQEKLECRPPAIRRTTSRRSLKSSGRSLRCANALSRRHRTPAKAQHTVDRFQCAERFLSLSVFGKQLLG